ncbi:MAG: 5'-nucleotidase [Bacteroidota bacterium]|nr:5'-nucleotidase [Bacteroidota bacterium]MDP3145044.1 5'-nucleotidase [Bacteroidota bacterium]MDP3556076.1 5'-nucleotidase [Bacteroidota bacterium]
MKARIISLFFTALLLFSCSKTYVKQKEDFTHNSLKQNSESENAKITIAEYKVKVDSATQKVIAITTNELLKDKEESTLGNFVCDALNYSAQQEFKNTPIDIVLINRGGLRVNLPKGEIRVINIFELMPFENDLALVKISGEKLLEGLQTLVEKKHSFLGLQLKVENNKLIEAKINNEVIDKTKNYTVVTSDYLAYGGDNFIFLKDPIELQKSNLRIRDAIINYCSYLTENKKQIIPYTDGRFQFSK